jgi:hypothetical protein
MWNVGRDAGADDDEVLLFECALAVIASFDSDAAIEKQRYLVVQFFLGLCVRDGDTSALVSQKQSAGDAGLAQPDDEYALAFDIHAREHPNGHCATFIG